MDELSQWIDAINKGGIFGRRTRHDLSMIERQTAHEWATAYSRDFERHVTQIVSGTSGRLPDCFGQLNGLKISIELTELLDRQALKARRAGVPGSFERSQWSVERVAGAITKRVLAKQSKCLAQSFHLDALIIHTDELWLQASTVEEWLGLGGLDASQAPNIKSAWLLQSYSWKLHRIFGDL